MKVYEMIEKISTAQDKETADKYLAYAENKWPVFKWLMDLNNGNIKIDGIPKDFNIEIKYKEKSQFGKSLVWFWQGSAFKFLSIPEGQRGFSPEKKRRVLENMVNSIPYDEYLVFMSAFRGELIDYEGHIDTRVDADKYKAVLSIFKEKKEDEVVVQVETEVTDNLLPEQPTVNDELVVEDKPKKEKKWDGYYRNPKKKSEKWKGKGRKPKWVVAHLEEGGELEDLK